MTAPCTALRHAADLSFLLRQASFAARDLELKAPDVDTRIKATRIKAVTAELRKVVREVEENL